MTPEQDSFEDLRRLLALKRHEQPPPGYFNQFSRQVIARIKAGETAESESFFERLLPRVPWLRSLWNGFEAKPIVAGAFGIGVCSLLVVGLVSSERMDSAPLGFATSEGSPQPILANVQSQNSGFLERAFADHSMTGSVYSAPSHSIFDEIRPQPVNFSVPSLGN
jgi:hypothetical protein